jgi:hypothetical protein
MMVEKRGILKFSAAVIPVHAPFGINGKINTSIKLE